MTREEFANIAAILRSVYQKDGFLSDKASVSIWFDLLQDLEGAVVLTTVKTWLATSEWPPTIADIRKGATISTNGQLPDWGDAWGEVLKAIRIYGFYRADEAVASLDEITRDCVRNLGGFEALCLSENPESDRANFRMVYESKKARADRDAQVPDSVKLTQKTMGLLE